MSLRLQYISIHYRKWHFLNFTNLSQIPYTCSNLCIWRPLWKSDTSRSSREKTLVSVTQVSLFISSVLSISHGPYTMKKILLPPSPKEWNWEELPRPDSNPAVSPRKSARTNPIWTTSFISFPFPLDLHIPFGLNHLALVDVLIGIISNSLLCFLFLHRL